MGIPKGLIYSFFPFLQFVGMSARVPTMVFVDGENLSKRYKDRMEKRGMGSTLAPSPWYEPDVFLWSDVINELCSMAGVTRKNYYTSVVGSDQDRTSIEERLKEAGIESPYVFKRPKKASGRPSKAVDISLAVDMLTHASRRNYTLAILIAGDGDYVPLDTFNIYYEA